MKNLFQLLIFTIMFFAGLAACETVLSQAKLNSPDRQIELKIELENGTPRYAVWYRGNQILKPSTLGFELQMPINGCFEIIAVNEAHVNETSKLIYGETNQINDNYNSIKLELQEVNVPTRLLNIEFRAYNEGIAFRYIFPEQKAVSSITILKELSTFRFNDWAKGYPIYEGEATFSKVSVPIKDIKPGAHYPLTINTGFGFASILEAQVVNYPRLQFGKTTSGDLVTSIMGEASVNLPFSSPWRFILLGETEGQLIQNEQLILKLNVPSELKDVTWIKPGKTISNEASVPLNTVELKKLIDFASDNGFSYLQLDWGWYGTEVKWTKEQIEIFRKVMPKRMENTNWEENTKADPFTVAKGWVPYGWDERWKDFQTFVDLDMNELVEYGQTKGVGICLYIEASKTLRANNLDSLFSTYQKWGIAGIKPGFVRYGSQENTEWIRNMVAVAATHKLWVDIHDAHVPDGMERTFPNLFTNEGGGGAEGKHQVVQDVMLPFTRCLAGPFDYTPFFFTKGRSNAHMMAMLVAYWSPTHVIRGGYLAWPGDGTIGIGGEEIEFLKRIPSTWDETRVLDAKIGEHLVVARRSGESWYIGGITGESAKQSTIDLDFLKSGINYITTVFSDEDRYSADGWCRTTKRVIVRSRNDKLYLEMNASGGVVALVEPIKN